MTVIFMLQTRKFRSKEVQASCPGSQKDQDSDPGVLDSAQDSSGMRNLASLEFLVDTFSSLRSTVGKLGHILYFYVTDH